MKLKYYLRGLGTGIIITTIVLYIAFTVRESENNLAENYNETVASETQETTEEVETEEVEEITTEAIETETSEEVTTESVETEAAQEVTTEEIQTESITNDISDNSSADVSGTSTITISSGMSSESVVNMLQTAGIIDNSADFNNYLNANGFSTIIRVGTYDVPQNATYLDIANIICGY